VAATLVGEAGSRAVVTTAPGKLQQLLQLAGELGVPARAIGHAGGADLSMAVDGVPAITCAVAAAEQVWADALGRHFAGRAA
jgi:hypothetical protein